MHTTGLSVYTCMQLLQVCQCVWKEMEKRHKEAGRGGAVGWGEGGPPPTILSQVPQDRRLAEPDHISDLQRFLQHMKTSGLNCLV